MESLRKVAAVVGRVLAGIYLAVVVFDMILGLSRGWVLVATVAFGLVGVALGFADARELTPWSKPERRDAVIGWSIVLGLITVIAAVALVSATVDG